METPYLLKHVLDMMSFRPWYRLECFGAHYFGQLCRHTQICYHGDRDLWKTKAEFENINSVD